MTAINSIYISCIEPEYNADFIANVFERNGIAQVSMVYIEPEIIKNNCGYNRAYIAIHSWHETEAAYNFIERLRNPSREARMVYKDDNWWTVFINKNKLKLTRTKRVLTVFKEKPLAEELTTLICDDASSSCDELDNFVHIDAEKTRVLRNVISAFKDEANMADYLREMNCLREIECCQ